MREIKFQMLVSNISVAESGERLPRVLEQLSGQPPVFSKGMVLGLGPILFRRRLGHPRRRSLFLFLASRGLGLPRRRRIFLFWEVQFCRKSKSMDTQSLWISLGMTLPQVSMV